MIAGPDQHRLHERLLFQKGAEIGLTAGLEHSFHEPERERRPGRKFSGESVGPRHQIVVRDDVIEHTQSEGTCGVELAIGEQQVARRSETNETRQEPRDAEIGDEREPTKSEEKLRAVPPYSEIAS